LYRLFSNYNLVFICRDQVLSLYPKTPGHLRLLTELEKEHEDVSSTNHDNAFIIYYLSVFFPEKCKRAIKLFKKQNMFYP